MVQRPQPQTAGIAPVEDMHHLLAPTGHGHGQQLEILVAAPTRPPAASWRDRKSTRLNSSHANISYAVFCLKKKTKTQDQFTVSVSRRPNNKTRAPTSS